MQNYIRDRVLELSRYIIESGATVRQTAERFGVSKSTVHKDVTERLPQVSETIADRVRRVLDNNKAERHLRGGEATKRKYQETRQESAASGAVRGIHRRF